MSLTDTSSAKLSFIRLASESSAFPATPAMLDLPFTSESLSEKLTSAQSAAMRDDRQFSSSRLVRAETTGDMGLELAYGLWFDEILSGVMQAAAFPASPASTDSDDMLNGATRTFFGFEKGLEAESGMQYMRFQGCQISTLSIDVQSNALVTMTAGIVGLSSENSPSSDSVHTAYDLTDQMDSNATGMLEFKDSGNTAIDVTAQSFSLSLDNQMRGQQAVGSFYNAGNASGRFKATMSASIYFRNQDIYQKFVDNEGIKVIMTLPDTAGNYYKFTMENVKTTSYDISAGGADQDLVASVELQAFPAASMSDKTLKITRYTA